MTQILPNTAPETAPPRDLQRESLEQIVKLSIECSQQEKQIEEQHTEAVERENAEFESNIRSLKQRHHKRVAELTSSSKKRQDQIQSDHDSKRAEVEAAHQNAQRQVTRDKEEADSALKKKVEKFTWQSESGLVTIEMQADVEDKKLAQEHETRLAELTVLETEVRHSLTPFKLAPFSVDAPQNAALNERLASEPRAVNTEHRTQAARLLQDLRDLGQPRVAASMIPVLLIFVAAAICAGIGWVAAPEENKIVVAASAGGGALVLGFIAFFIYRGRKQGQLRAKAKDVYVQLMESIAIARKAQKAEADAQADARALFIDEARRKSVAEINNVREKARAVQRQTADQHKTAVANELESYQQQLAAIDQEKQQGLAELAASRDESARQIESEESATRHEARDQHAAALAAIESQYENDTKELTARWNDGLIAVNELLAAGSGIDPRLVDWNSPAWDQWKAPTQNTGQVRFGDMKVDLAQLTEHVPKRLKVPESFTVPAMLALPARGSLLVDADHSGRAASNELAQLVMARILTQMPAGRAKFTIFDPVGLGQTFAGFMHLADHDESLVGSRIWTEKEHMDQRLADLTEHMETVIQKYLRNEYATIDEYNAQAGELAEPYRFLVIADFPTGFEQESLRRLSSIAITGPRCGVYTIILRDTRQQLPHGVRMEEIVARSVHLVWKDGEFIWDDAVFKRFPLKVDAPPGEKTLTKLMDLVGKAAKEAKRVEVPFQSIAPPDDQFWSQTSASDLRVPIGKSGATRLQSLRLGIGVAQHVLVAGKTGSGKSNLMHTIVTNMAMWYGPDEVEFYLVDFKKGVEFKAYASSQLPHARAIAVESDREFGLSVLQRVDAELTRRGTLFRDVGAQEINGYRERTGQKLPRTVLLIDEFQEFFSEDDKLAQEAAGLLDRLVRQGRAFGVHVVLGSQTIGGSSGLARSTLGQIAVRVALQCSEADSQMILGDNNSAARLLTRPGEAVYNDAGGLVEANSPFQIAFLPDEQREEYLDRVHQLTEGKHIHLPTPIVFEGNSAAAIRNNHRLIRLLQQDSYPPETSSVLTWVGEPVAIKDPTAIPFRRQSGANVLLVGQQEESAIAVFASMVASIAAQQKPGDAIFYLVDGTPADSRYFGVLERVMNAIPQETKVIGWRDVPDAINELATLMSERQGDEGHSGPSVYLMVFGLQRFRVLRRQEEEFSFKSSDEPAAPKPDKQLAELLSEGPGLGIHNIIWADTPITLERTLERSSMRQFDHRVLFQMSASDSSNLIDSPQANRLGDHRALLYSEEQGTIEKCRPYEVPGEEWLAFLAERLGRRPK
jgi:hypothetical protein